MIAPRIPVGPFIVASIFFGHATWADARPLMLPPPTKDPSLDSLYDIGEQPMWREPFHGQATRYRVSLIGISCRAHMIRFDERENGGARGEVKIWNRCHRDEPYEARDFVLRRSQLDTIKAAMIKAKFWRQPASYWTVQDKDTICVDGIDVTFERRDGLDYRMDTSNVWCGTTREFVVAARILLIAANDRAGLGLLPAIDNDR